MSVSLRISFSSTDIVVRSIRIAGVITRRHRPLYTARILCGARSEAFSDIPPFRSLEPWPAFFARRSRRRFCLSVDKLFSQVHCAANRLHAHVTHTRARAHVFFYRVSDATISTVVFIVVQSILMICKRHRWIQGCLDASSNPSTLFLLLN